MMMMMTMTMRMIMMIVISSEIRDEVLVEVVELVDIAILDPFLWP